MFRKQGHIPLGPPRKRRLNRSAILFVLALLALGAAVPHLDAVKLPLPEGEPADAILVPAGGEKRIAEGFRAWQEGKAKHLFILGAGREATLERILPGKPDLAPSDLDRIHIEAWSENTLENAVSARAAVTERRFAKVILVTSGYHVARAYLALRTILPEDVAISVIPVWPDVRVRSIWWRVPVLYFTEGWKYWGYRLLLRWK